jgi:hypothetical protein
MTPQKPSRIKAMSIGMATLGFLGVFFFPGSMLWVLLLVIGLAGYFFFSGGKQQ